MSSEMMDDQIIDDRKTHSSAEFGRFVSMSIGSAGEMLTWIDYCRDLKYVMPDTAQRWLEEYKTILKMLQKLKTNIRSSII